MSVARTGRAEPELRQSSPRSVRLTAAGRLELAATIGPVVALTALNAWLFFRRPQPPAIEIGFTLVALTGAGLLWRLGVIWMRRVELVRDGRPTPAVIVDKGGGLLGWRRYRAWYSLGDEQRAADAFAPGDAAEIGDAVTVLRLADESGERALIYPLCGCAAADARDAPSNAALTRL